MIVVTDGAGPVGSLVADRLLSAGERLRTIGSNDTELRNLTQRGAEPWYCEPTNEIALAAAFRGATAAYLAIPHSSKYHEDFIELFDRISNAYASAIVHAGLRYVVTQSSAGLGSHSTNRLLMAFRTFENRIDLIPHLHALHIRPGHFLENLGTEIIPGLNLLVGAIAPHVPLSVVFTHDVAAYAAERLQKRDFTGCQARELLGQRDLTMPEIARALGGATVRYVQLPQAALKHWMSRIGLPNETASVILDLWDNVNNGQLMPSNESPTSNRMPTSLEAAITRRLSQSVSAGVTAKVPLKEVVASGAAMSH